jgi:type II secretory ATPase GspE/PulE/Tfp pilus assembly ATPase PilB-like protein
MRLPLPPEQLKSMLAAEGLVAPEQFDVLLAEADRKSQSVLDVLVSQRVVEEGYLGSLIAKALGVERANFMSRPIDNETVKLVPESMARERQAIVFRREPDGAYDVAMADPSDLETIELFAQRLKGKIQPFLATSGDLNRGFSVYGYAVGQDFKKLIEENMRASLAQASDDIREVAAQLPIVGIVDNILSYAMASRASDIHIEILEETIIIRYRIDGILYPIMELSKAIHPAIVARVKILAGLKIDEHYAPQDGRFHYTTGNQEIDVRVSIIPTFHGEKVEMRLLEGSQKPLGLEEIGFLSDDVGKISRAVKKSYGMILSCGPTGSGKSTTLYALMNILNRPEVNITTVEDPIEYNMRYVNQTQINSQAGITFASGLRALLRQDPNIIMVGEIRDAETADIAVEAALTGHLLLSSLHTNDAPTAVPRLFDLNVPPFLVSSVLTVVIGQRLVRRVCQTCLYSYEPGADVVSTVAQQAKEIGADLVVKVPKLLYRGRGCSDCGQTGYRGRLGIFEILEVDDHIRAVIASPDFSLEKISAAARKNGMHTMFEDGMQKVELAMTTLEEVLRVIRE